MQGLIGGEDWQIKFGNAFLFSTDFKYQFRFLSTREGVNDPCGLPSTANAHVSMIMKLQQSGSFSVPFPVTSESPRFHFSDGSTAIATGGFLEIFATSQTQTFGYLQAQLDDNTTVEGSS